MSKITNIIITGYGHNDSILVDKIEEILPEISGNNSVLKFTRVDGYARCSYCLEMQIWIAAINYLGLNEFKRRVSQIIHDYQKTSDARLNHPVSIQIFLKEDGDNKVREFKW